MSEVNIVKFLALNEDAVIPQKGTEQSAGFDLVSMVDCTIRQGAPVAIPLGFATEIPTNIHCRIESRSGMALKNAVVLTGVIDSDYRGEWKVIMGNLGTEVISISKGQRIAQGVFRETPKVRFEAVSDLLKTSRGAGGFGSTGR